MVKFKMTSVDLTMAGPLPPGSTSFLSKILPSLGDINSEVLFNVGDLHCTWGVGSPVTVQLNTAKVD